MSSINDITGDKIQSKGATTDAYRDSWERVFGKKGKTSPCQGHSQCTDGWVLGEPACEVKQDKPSGCCGECC